MRDDGGPIGVVIPTLRRPGRLADTLARIAACDPPPAEVIVHVDHGDDETPAMLAARFPRVRVIEASTRQGPGGGRNRAMAAAASPWVASFDDDSWPMDPAFFAQARAAIAAHPEAAVIGCAVVHPGEAAPAADGRLEPAATFTGCGVLYRRRAFLAAGGYVPLARAYGMEESDLALRITGAGGRLYRASGLAVRHDTDRAHHAEPALNAASISNLALLAFLRYPPAYWPLGAAQVLGRLAWLAGAGRFRGMARGVAEIPGRLWRLRAYRSPVAVAALRAHRALLREHG